MSHEPQGTTPAPAFASPTAGPPPGAGSGAPAAPARGDDVIHNIGYRHYDGPRLGRRYARRSLFVQSLRGCYGLGRSAKSKVLPAILVAVMCLPAAILVAVAIVGKSDDLPLGYNEYVIRLQPVIGIFIAFVAPQAVSLDLRFRVVPLYFSRPICRGDYVGAKYAALASALFFFTTTPLVLLYVGALLARMDFGHQTKGVALGLVCTALFSLLHAAIGMAVAAFTPRRGFGVAAIVAALTIPYMLVSALQGIAGAQDNASAVGWLGLASPGTLVNGVQGAFLGGETGFPGGDDPTAVQASVYVVLIAALVAGCCALMLRRYRKAGL